MKKHVKTLCLSGLFTALVFVFTAFFHVPSHTGYTHIGDAFVYLAACLLPLPYALFVGAVGAALADLLTGFALWVPASLVIKGLSVLFFSRKGRIVCLPNILALLASSLVCIGGYYLYEAIITDNFMAPAAGIPGYLTQSILSSLLFLILGLALDKLNIRRNLL